MALIGYARVSTQDQHLHLQKDALTSAGCIKIYTDTMSGGATDRKGLDDAIGCLRKGDTLVVWRLDRLGRSLKHLIEIVTALHERGIGLKSLTEQIDTGTSGGKLVFHIFGALAEFERNLIQERTNAGASRCSSSREERWTAEVTYQRRKEITHCQKNARGQIIISSRDLQGTEHSTFDIL